MRPIKFRGKRKDNGEWAEGYYFSVKKDAYILPEQEGFRNAHIPISQYGYPPLMAILTDDDFIEVDPATVGQFTGRLDKNKNEYYAGDIARQEYVLRDSNPDSDDGDEGYYIGEVAISTCMGVVLRNPSKTNAAGKTIKLKHCIPLRQYRSEKIGNIHDNPELAEDKK